MTEREAQLEAIIAAALIALTSHKASWETNQTWVTIHREQIAAAKKILLSAAKDEETPSRCCRLHGSYGQHSPECKEGVGGYKDPSERGPHSGEGGPS